MFIPAIDQEMGKKKNLGDDRLLCRSIATCYYYFNLDDLLLESHILLSSKCFFSLSSESKSPQGTGERRLSLTRKPVGRILGFRCQLEA